MGDFHRWPYCDCEECKKRRTEWHTKHPQDNDCGVAFSLEDERTMRLRAEERVASLEAEALAGEQAEVKRAAMQDALREKLASSEAKLAEVTATKDGAYDERNRCVAALAWLAIKLGYRAGVNAHEGPEDFGDWKHVCKIQLPVGQCSWHFTDAQAEYFVGLPHDDTPWDGHTTPEKYERLARLRWLPTQTEKLAVAVAALRSFALHWNAWRRPQDMAKAAQLVLDQLKKLEVE